MAMENIQIRTRATRKLIRITFPDGEVICYNNATSTMIAALNKIGPDKFSAIKLELCHLPLLSKDIYPQYKDWMKPVCDGWYLNAQSNSDNKYLQLRSISDQFSLGLVVELGTDFETQTNPNKTKKSRTKDKLLVKFPDGEFVGNGSALDTYLETIWKLGIDDIMRKHLTWGGKDLVTTSQVASGQIQVGERRWVMVPNMTKDKAKLLRVVAAMLRINLEITII